MKQTVIALLVLGFIGYFLLRGGNLGEERRRTELLQRRTPVEHRFVAFTVIYSPDKQAWVKDAANQFADERKDLQVKLAPMNSLASVDAILNREITPTVWMPEDMGVANYLSHKWKQDYEEPLFPTAGIDAPSSLLRSPLVMVIWESRLQALAWAQSTIEQSELRGPWLWVCQAVGEELTWSDLLAEVDTPDDYKKELQRWGNLKFNHTDPSHSNAGMLTLFVLAHEFFGYPAEAMTVERLRDESFLSFFRECERNISSFPESTEQLTRDMLRHGPKDFDIVATYEHIAITQLFESPGERPQIFYAGERIAWSDHPAILLDLEPLPQGLSRHEQDDLRIRRRQAARDWITFLRDRPSVQRKAIKYGFRPTLHLVQEEINDPKSPFNRFRVVIDLEKRIPTLPAPSGEVVDALMGAWLNR